MAFKGSGSSKLGLSFLRYINPYILITFNFSFSSLKASTSRLLSLPPSLCLTLTPGELNIPGGVDLPDGVKVRVRVRVRAAWTSQTECCPQKSQDNPCSHPPTLVPSRCVGLVRIPFVLRFVEVLPVLGRNSRQGIVKGYRWGYRAPS